MADWLEEDSTESGAAARRRAVLDEGLIREPISLLGPPSPLSLPPEAPLRDAVQLMREHRVGCILVVEDRRLVGIVTERDLLLKVDLDAPRLGQPLREVMTPDPEALGPEDPIVYALNKMSVGGFRHVPLVDECRRPVGIVSVKDVVEYIVDLFPNQVLTVPLDPARAKAWRGRDGA